MAIGKEWVIGETLNSLHGAVGSGSYTHDITVGKKKEVAAAFRAMKTE